MEHIEEHITECEKELDDDAESIITNQRYAYISKLIDIFVEKKNKSKLNTSDKIDLVLTNKWLALPIFALVMFIVYYISVTTVGTIVTDFTNDTLFGEWIIGPLSTWLEGIGVAGWLTGPYRGWYHRRCGCCPRICSSDGYFIPITFDT